jgi:hypothetical protein
LDSGQRNARVREEAQRAVTLAAQHALEQVCLPGSKEGTKTSDHSALSKVSSQHSDDRGPEGRLFDGLESNVMSPIMNVGGVDELISFPPSTNTDSMSENGGMKHNNEKKTRKWTILHKLKRPQLENSKFALTSEISKEAWMCGVCAKSFSSFEAAQHHEDFHIREVVEDLGFATFFENDSSFILNHSNEEKEFVDYYLYHGLVPHSSDLTTRTPQQTFPETPQQVGGLGSFQTTSTKKPRPDVLSMSSPSLHGPSIGLQYPDNTPALKRKRKSKEEWSQDLDDPYSQTGFYEENSEFNLTTTILRPNSIMSPIYEHQPIHRTISDEHNHLAESAGRHHDWDNDEHGLMLPHGMRDYVVLADEALADVCAKAKSLMLTPAEDDAELELEYLAEDKAYYDMLYSRDAERRRRGRYSQFRAEGKSMLSKVQNKFVDAYQLMKEGKSNGKASSMDYYTRKLKGDIDTIHILENSKKTLYVNVIVKASLEVVSHELQRLAKQRWEAAQAKNTENDPRAQQFQQFRALAQDNLVKLAGMALAADFTPRRIAIQLSNDLYR